MSENGFKLNPTKLFSLYMIPTSFKATVSDGIIIPHVWNMLGLQRVKAKMSCFGRVSDFKWH